MAHYLDPKNDLTFKRVFGEHPHLCMSLLNSMLPFDEEHQIVSLEYQSGELVPEIPALKNSIVDVRCIDKLGRQFIVEMQMLWTDSFTSRVLLNASKAYLKQLDRGKEFKCLQPVYVLSFVNEIFEKKIEAYYHHYKIVNVLHTEKQIKGLEFVFIELPKFKPKTLGTRKLMELWLRYLTEIKESVQDIPDELRAEEDLWEAIQYLEQGAYSKEQLEAYDKYWDIIRTEMAIRSDSLELGRAEGLAKGKAEGLAEGEAKTLENVVLNAHNNGVSLEQIQAFTGLSAEKIAGILKQK